MSFVLSLNIFDCFDNSRIEEGFSEEVKAE